MKLFERKDGKGTPARIYYTSGTMIVKSGEEYLNCLTDEMDFVEITQEAPEDGYYNVWIRHFSEEKSFQSILIDGLYVGGMPFSAVDRKTEVTAEMLHLKKGIHKITLLKNWGTVALFSMELKKAEKCGKLHRPSFSLCNPGASEECLELMRYFKGIYGKKIITGQHTDYAMKDVDFLERVTGRKPALAGFDLLSYSAFTAPEEATKECRNEVAACRDNVGRAIRWAKEEGGMLTLCWHWYSPGKGRDKSFYTMNTDYDLAKALTEKGKDYELLIRDMDLIAGQLKRLKAEGIPVLWRPLHEADGKWFWWGASGAEAYRSLYRLMYDRFTRLHGLNNLIWVFNAPCEGWYPGDDVVDLICMDIYGPKGNTGALELEYQRGIRLPDTDKPIGLGEVGTMPELGPALETAPWLWFMLWSGFTRQDESNSRETLRRNFQLDCAVTLEDWKEAGNIVNRKRRKTRNAVNRGTP